MKTNLEQIKKKVLPILKGAGVTRSSVFGSYARGDAGKKSDIDILVEIPEDMSLLGLVRLQRELENALGKKVDLLTYRSVNPLLKDYIQKNQVRIL